MGKSFAETAMELSGKTAAESTSMGKVDIADDQVEELFDDKHQTKNSPAFKAGIKAGDIILEFDGKKVL